MPTHVDVYTHSGGKMSLVGWFEALVAQLLLFKRHVAVALFHLFLETLHVSKVLSLYPHLFSYALGLSGCWLYEWVLFSLSLFRAVQG